ncbi:leukocyte receptor cluster member 1 isoform X2 [Tachyglossus aculeatus]|uniref:leukocyte receptor cluster member 1 isoform X2 n=1 Tax=Tachyglossus aculeatus TaxID=9261 RepID=UPI0018F6FE3A|nr:leukocyte receptor cluster member 1 isoform X2 [Tachyglossus aculeatus]
MNILPKKSWHVRNKDNVARVRRDEAQAREEERERERRARLAQQEARTDFLRKKARRELLGEEAGGAASPGSGHVDLFRGLEDGRGALSANKEHEEEKRQEKERQEKALGLLTYLGQSAAEAQTNPPWYQKPPERGGTAPGPKEDKLKGRLDPLRELERQLRKKKGGGEKRKREPDGKGSAGGPLQGPASLEQLRAERLKREAAERARAEALLAGGGRGPQPREPDEEPDERRRRYNSQFHPELARPPRAHDKAPRR